MLTCQHNPSKVGNISLCRTYLKTDNAEFKKDISRELSKRGLQKSNCASLVNKQNTQIVVGAVVAAAAIYCAVECGNTGAGTYHNAADWDQFYDEKFQLVWACRDITSGRFANSNNCAGLPKTDVRWPSRFC